MLLTTCKYICLLKCYCLANGTGTLYYFGAGRFCTFREMLQYVMFLFMHVDDNEMMIFIQMCSFC